MKTNTIKEISFTLDADEARKVYEALTVDKSDINFDYYRRGPSELVQKLRQFVESNKR